MRGLNAKCGQFSATELGGKNLEKKHFVYGRADEEHTTMVSYCFLTGCVEKENYEICTDRLALLCN